MAEYNFKQITNIFYSIISFSIMFLQKTSFDYDKTIEMGHRKNIIILNQEIRNNKVIIRKWLFTIH